MNEFAGRVALITGGTRGIGRACAERFAAAGARVAVCSRDADAARDAAQAIGGNAIGYGCDISDATAVSELFTRISADAGPVDILINNAGSTRDGLLMRMKDSDWDAVIQNNLTSLFYVCRAAARDMIKRRYGRIVNMTSIVGLHGQAGQTNYAAAKAGIIGFTKAYAQEVASRNITVNAIAPGFIETAMTGSLDASTRAKLVERIPLHRAGVPRDIAGAAVFLASDDAAYITGTVLSIDGGLGM